MNTTNIIGFDADSMSEAAQPAQAPVRFEQFFTYEQYVAGGAYMGQDVEMDDPGQKAAFRAFLDEIDVAAAQFMTSLFDAGSMQRIEHTERRGIPFASAWNRMVEGEREDYTVRTVARPLSKDLYTALCRVNNLSNRGPVSLPHEYARLCDSYSTGVFRHAFIVDSDEVCNATGLSIHTYVRSGWRPALVQRTAAGPSWRDGSKYSRVGPTPVEEVLHVTIPAPSGRMLIADWFRFDDNLFTELVDARNLNFKINTSFGCRQQTEHYAREHGFLSVSVGNSSPGVFRRKDHDLLGSSNGELPSAVTGKQVASVCTDLWWATIIDEEVLRNKVCARLGVSAGQAAFDRFIAEGSFEVFSVAPGTLHAYFTAQRGALSRFKCETTQISRRGFYDVYAVLSHKELAWTPCAPGEDPCPTGLSKRAKP